MNDYNYYYVSNAYVLFESMTFEEILRELLSLFVHTISFLQNIMTSLGLP